MVLGSGKQAWAVGNDGDLLEAQSAACGLGQQKRQALKSRVSGC